MKQKSIPQVLSVFVCTHGGGKKCSGGKKLCSQLKKEIKRRKMQDAVQIVSSGCMDQCEKGPNVMIFPDNIWLCKVQERDIDEIMEHLSAHIYQSSG